jgi:hypothetical protein
MRVLRAIFVVLRALLYVPRVMWAGLLGIARSLRAPKRERIVDERDVSARAE